MPRSSALLTRRRTLLDANPRRCRPRACFAEEPAVFVLDPGAAAGFAPVNAEMNRFLADPAEIDRILGEGARKAQAIAAPIVSRVKDIVGFLRS